MKNVWEATVGWLRWPGSRPSSEDGRMNGSSFQDGVSLPWEIFQEESTRMAVRDQVLALSHSVDGFLNAPPDGLRAFDFDLQDYAVLAEACLRADPRLGQVRYRLVPQRYVSLSLSLSLSLSFFFFFFFFSFFFFFPFFFFFFFLVFWFFFFI